MNEPLPEFGAYGRRFCEPRRRSAPAPESGRPAPAEPLLVPRPA